MVNRTLPCDSSMLTSASLSSINRCTSPTVLRGTITPGMPSAPLPKGADGMPGVIVPRKTVGEVQRLIEDNEAEVKIELSQGKVRFTIGHVVLTSKLIDGTFPDYGRVIPQNNDKELIVDKKDFEAAVDRVSTISSERGRAEISRPPSTASRPSPANAVAP